MRPTAYFVGNVTRDPEVRETGGGTTVSNFSISVNSKVGEETQTEYFDFVAWRKTAEFVAKYIRKGTRVTIAAQPKTREYEDKNGNKRKVVEFWVNDIDPHEWAKNETDEKDDTTERRNKSFAQVKETPSRDDLPF